MNQGKYVFAQIVEFLPYKVFDKFVSKWHNTLFDDTTQIPAFVHISPAAEHDVNAMDYLLYEPEAYYF